MPYREPGGFLTRTAGDRNPEANGSVNRLLRRSCASGCPGGQSSKGSHGLSRALPSSDASRSARTGRPGQTPCIRPLPPVAGAVARTAVLETGHLLSRPGSSAETRHQPNHDCGLRRTLSGGLRLLEAGRSRDTLSRCRRAARQDSPRCASHGHAVQRLPPWRTPGLSLRINPCRSVPTVRVQTHGQMTVRRSWQAPGWLQNQVLNCNFLWS
jgi:hypothetical protein